MIDKLTSIADWFRKIPAAFLVAIVTVLALILFLPDELSKKLAVDGFRDQFRVILGPVFLLTVAFFVARCFSFFMTEHKKRKHIKAQQDQLHKLTPQEKAYLAQFVLGQQNTLYVGIEDGVMGGLCAKGIAYRSANIGDMLNGFAFNLQPWAREYLEENPSLLEGAEGGPKTPRQKLYEGW